MPFLALLIMSVITLTMSGTWASLLLSARPRYRADGYRMIRRRQRPSATVTNALGAGAFGGLGVALLGWAVLG